MTRLLRVRVVPIVLLATICLFALKVAGLLFGIDTGSSTQRPTETVVVRNLATANGSADSASQRRRSWAQEMLGYPADGQPTESRAPSPTNLAQNPLNALDVTGSVGASKEPGPKPGATKGGPVTASVPPVELAHTTSPAERAILERLQERRGDLEARERELDMREKLLQATEKRLEERVGELKSLEARINETLQKKDETEAARFKSLVSMYENMKAKEAARIFDRLDIKVLLDVTSQINPRRMSDILAQMSPEAAEKLTVELANRINGKTAAAMPAASLPKIEGKPTN